MPPAKLRPGRVWYWVALGAVLAGVAWAVISFVLLIGRVDSFPRVPEPGTGVLFLARGSYVIYYEGPGASSGAVPPGGVRLDPAAGSGGMVGNIKQYSASLTYQFGSHEGRAVASLQIIQPGRFVVRATSSGAPPGSQLAFGSSIAGWIVTLVVPTAVLVVAGVGVAIAIAIIRHIRPADGGQL